jgi:hypothetical protein
MKTITTMAALLALGGCTERTDLVDRDGAADATRADAVCGASRPFTGPPTLLAGFSIGVTGRTGNCAPSSLPVHVVSGALVTDCLLGERPAAGEPCDPLHGRRPRGDGTCLVDQLAVPVGRQPAAGLHGFYFRLGEPGGCDSVFAFTAGDEPATTAIAECVDRFEGEAVGGSPAGSAPVGAACEPTHPRAPNCPNGVCLFDGTQIYAEINNRQCQSGVCTSYRWPEQTDPERRDLHVHCNCRCGVPDALRSLVDPSTLCACPTGFACTPMLGDAYGRDLAGSYCVHSGFVSP